MNKIINLAGDKFMSEFHCGPFTKHPCGPFTKHPERIQKIRETGNLRHLYRRT